MRKDELINDEYYHVFNRSIAKFKIFNSEFDYHRFLELIKYYQYERPTLRYSYFNRLSANLKQNYLSSMYENSKIVDIVSYCLMPTHFHLLLKQNIDDGIVDYLRLIENSYSKYFNLVHKRKGPLWESRFKNVHIETDEQILHLTRYIHLNPTSAGFCNKPEEWGWSSYSEYTNITNEYKICSYKNILDIKPKEYQKFVNDRKKYQQELSKIKSHLIDNYSG
ncbi:MAG: hypothetical protein ACD_12C00357G0002 [uncultured bacterium]|uniref:Transposase IS200-like domain-containing protein n=1 Tax=Berkelbacteria bacterium GW2011_GWA2_35_9 TaxID=1618333 RepID=A0A0G0FN83_9BACT|nr:MAG: hypothetical protein ACD_12C00357G0002 [uncultured bacterium]KKP88905.1 MAG: hypothetical protein UR93_C0006G0038 [Berkelbacteria bacterium GW2011_GWA2_35_9]